MNLQTSKQLENIPNKNENNENFIEKLHEFLENTTSKLFPKTNSEAPKQSEDEVEVSIISDNIIRNKRSELLKEYSKLTSNLGALYFIFKKLDDKKCYTVFKIEDGKKSTIKIHENELPEDTKINSIFRMTEGKYILDDDATKKIQEELNKITNEVLEKQENRLNNYRKEGHLYRVEENVNGKIYLWDITEKSKTVIEELEFPKELIDKATEGAVFKYVNGKYEFCSNEGNEI